MTLRQTLFLLALFLSIGCAGYAGGVPDIEQHAPEFIEQKAPPPDDPPARKIEKVWYDQGHLFSETDLFSDRNNGFYKTYHRNGQPRTEVRYKNGWLIYDKAFDESGQPIIRQGEVKDFYADGTLCEVVRYKNDKKEGEAKYFFYDGKTVVDVWHYLNGRQAGIHTRNNAQGQFVYQEDWGYPSGYVQKLKRVIQGLSALAILLITLIGLLLFRRTKS